MEDDYARRYDYNVHRNALLDMEKWVKPSKIMISGLRLKRYQVITKKRNILTVHNQLTSSTSINLCQKQRCVKYRSLTTHIILTLHIF